MGLGDLPTLRRALLALLATAALLMLAGLAANSEPIEFNRDGEPRERQVAVGEQQQPDREPAETITTPEFPDREPSSLELPAWILWIFAALILLAMLYVVSLQRFVVRRRRGRTAAATAEQTRLTEEEEAEAIVEFTRDLIDELQDGDDPRIAIQRGYAAVETGFGVLDLTRRPAETPLDYLGRILGRNAAVTEPLGRLTDLFQIARFSDEPVTEAMRSDAIEAVGEIRTVYESRAGLRRRTATVGAARLAAAGGSGAADADGPDDPDGAP